jgi:predicted nucleic acid-binding protein
VATALNADVPVLYSEDIQHGLMIEERLQIRNLFLYLVCQFWIFCLRLQT